MPVSYSQPVPGWKASGRLVDPLDELVGRHVAVQRGPNTPRPIISACSGVRSMTMPQPEVPVSRSRTVTGRSAAVVRSSGASGGTRTRGAAASGSHRADRVVQGDDAVARPGPA